MSVHARKRLKSALFYLVVVLVTIPFLLVFVWMVLSSLKTQAQNTAIPPVLIFAPTLANYEAVLNRTPFAQYAWNSLLVGVAATGLGLILGLPAAYTIARYKQQKLAVAILTARIMPGISFLVPWFILFSQLRLIGSYPALILSHLLVTLPLVVWVLIGFFEDLPVELEEAARVDGCSTVGAFMRVSLPLAAPGVAATAILAFIFSWNNFLFSLVLANEQTKPLPVAVFNFMSYTMVDWGGLNAAATLITLPVVIMVLLIQRYIVQGLTLGGVKG